MLDVFAYVRSILICIVATLLPVITYASSSDAPTGIAYHGRIIKPNGDPLEGSNVDFFLEILGPGNKCILYKEKISVNMVNSSGVFSLMLGTGSRMDHGTHTFNDVFSNNAFPFITDSCYGGGTTYTSAPGDERTMKVSFDDHSNNVITLANDLKIRPVAYAINAEKLAGLAKTDFLQANTSTTQTKVDAFFAGSNSDKVLDLINGTPDTGAISIPTGTTAQRPSTAVAGMIRYNTSLNQTEVYDGSSWNVISGGGGGGGYLPLAGGAMTGAIDMGGQNFTNVGFITMGTSKTLHLSNNASDPAGLVAADAGKIWYNSTTKEFKYWDGTKAVAMVSKAGGDTITASGAAIKPLVLKGASSQSANLFEVDDSTSAAVATISATGAISASTDLATKSYVDTANTTQDTTIAGKVAKAGDTMTGHLVMSGQKEIRYGDSGSNYVGFKAPATIASSLTFTLPAADGTSGQVLSTNGSGVLSWASLAGGGDFKSDGSVAMTGSLKMGGNTIYGDSVSSGNLNLDSTSNATKGNIVMQPSGGSVGIGTASPSEKLYVSGGYVAVDNTYGLRVKDNGGTLRTILSLTSANNLQLTNSAASGDVKVGFNNASNTGSIRFLTDSATERMRVDNTGNVSIGVSTISTGARLDVGGGAINASPQGTSAGQGGEIRFDELAANGSNYVGFRSPDSIANNITWILPAADGTNGQVLTTDGSGNLSWASSAGGSVTGVTASAPLASSGGATPNISLTGTIPVANGGTNSTTALNNNRVVVSSGGAIVEGSAITANRALASNASGLPVASAVTDTELGYLSGVTSSVQTQINGKVSKAGGDTITASAAAVKPLVLKGAGSQSANLFEVDDSTNTAVATISSTGAVSASTDLATKSYVDTANSTQDTAISGKVSKSGDTMSGALNMGGSTLYGDSAASGNLTLDSTSNATKGNILLAPSGGNVGIGTSGPSFPLHLSASAANFVVLDVGSSVSTDAPNFVGRRARNSIASPQAVQTDDMLAFFGGRGYNGSAYTGSSRAGIEMSANETWNTSNNGAYMAFSTTSNGTTTRLERMRISHSGAVGINTTSPNGKLDVKGSIVMSGSTSGYAGFQPAAAAGSTVWTLPAADGTNGQALSTNGSGVLSWVTVGSGNGTVTNVSSTNSYISVATGGTTPVITANVGSGANTLAAGDDSRITGAFQIATSLGGDLSGTLPNPTIAKLNGTSLSVSSLTSGQFLKYNGTNWVNATIGTSDVNGLSTTYLTQAAFAADVASASCSNTQSMYWNSATGAFACQTVSAVASPSGSDGQVQFNSAGSMAASSNLYWDNTNSRVGIRTTSPGQALSVNGTIETTSGGIKFPDGSVQLSAAVSVASTTGVIHTGTSAPPAIGYVQGTSGAGTSIAFVSNVTAGDLLVVQLSAEGSVDPITVTDSVGTTYTKAVALSGYSDDAAIYYGIAPASGHNVVTGTQSSNWARMGVAEFSGFLANVDVTASVYNSAAAASANVTTTTDGELLFAAIRAYHSSNTFTAGGGFTMGAQSNGSDANGFEYRIATTAGTYSTSINIGGGASDNSPYLVVAFKSAGGGVGSDGDFFLNTSNNIVYGPRSAGAYSALGGFWGVNGANFYYNGGSVGVGTSSPSTKLHVVGSSGATIATFADGGATTCTVTPASTGFACSSDERLKKDIQPFSDLASLDKILQLRTVTYNWRSVDNGRHTGYIAQEVEKIAPEFVRTGEDGYKQVNYTGFIPWITGAIKAFYSEFKSSSANQEREIASLKAENENLKDRLKKQEEINQKFSEQISDIQKQIKMNSK